VRFEVPPGHALLLYPRRRHRGATPFGRDLSFYWIHWVFKPPIEPEALLEVPQLCRVERPECIAELFHRLLDDQESHRLEPRYASLLLLQILLEVGREPLVGAKEERTGKTAGGVLWQNALAGGRTVASNGWVRCHLRGSPNRRGQGRLVGVCLPLS